jgi:hypothetical protein
VSKQILTKFVWPLPARALLVDSLDLRSVSRALRVPCISARRTAWIVTLAARKQLENFSLPASFSLTLNFRFPPSPVWFPVICAMSNAQGRPTKKLSEAQLLRRIAVCERKVANSKAEDKSRGEAGAAEKGEKVNLCSRCHKSRLRRHNKGQSHECSEEDACLDVDKCPAHAFGPEHANRKHSGVLKAQDELVRLKEMQEQRAVESEEQVSTGFFSRLC